MYRKKYGFWLHLFVKSRMILRPIQGLVRICSGRNYRGRELPEHGGCLEHQLSYFDEEFHSTSEVAHAAPVVIPRPRNVRGIVAPFVHLRAREALIIPLDTTL